ncbi:protein TIC110, chloroplastic isoform X2 [Phalaenopsis equestris]|uniref:protein TIC110, chloroplastic isoform X2 n=1 Tax=Phalaenopsis equestris TaxID=78828 RepID=UPI0009E65A16|nr:protein TIC110, chloroplastic isoform X2 [Phalaenopsis equestris]
MIQHLVNQCKRGRFHPSKALTFSPSAYPLRLSARPRSRETSGARRRLCAIMDLSLLLPSPSSASRQLLFSPFSPNPLRVQSLKIPRTSLRYRFRLSAVTEAEEAVSSGKPPVFGSPKELTVPQKFVDALPPPARLASYVVFTGAALAAGFGLGLRFGGSKTVGIGGAAALGVAAGAAVYAINSTVPEVAAVNLHNIVTGYDDPTELKKEEIEAIAEKYGVSRQDEAFREELRDLYSRFVSSVLPSGAENLKGNEVERIIKFKNALGIDDPDAASVHMEIGRHIFRQRLETGDREADVEQRRAFQKLVYVSTLVFGEASKFLLPWKRLFKVTDAQVDIAIRDNAQRLFAVKLNSVGKEINETGLFELRSAQLLYRLSDEIAAEMFREHTRKLAEENISTALDLLKSRIQAGTTRVMEEIEKVLALNDLLTRLSKHPEYNSFVPGVGPISLLGGEYDSDRKIDDLKLLYRTYAAECFPNGRLEEQKLLVLNQLKNIFGLGNREADAILLDITVKAYRKRLSQAVSSGELDAASSKAAFLQNLCDELHFDPQKASEIHEEIYRQKLQQSVADGELSEEEVSSLLRIRVLLCIPQETVDAAHADICGRLFEKVVKDAISSGVDGYDADIRASVRKAAQGLRLTKESAMAIASKAVRKVFLNYVQRSRAAGNRTEAAKELKKMIAFNTLVVTELISDIKGEPITEEPIEVEVKQAEEEDDEWESLQTLRKSKPNKDLQAKLGKGGQTEINLKDDLPERDKTDLYRTYLLFCLSGEVTVVPFGAQIITKKDNSEYILLNQLGGILGLTGKEIVEVHRNLAEQAFMKQAEVILADGQLTKSKIDQLSEVQKQVGLPAEYAQKVIKNITTTKMAAAIETAVSQGRIGIQQVRELKEANVDLDSMISERLRENLFKKTVEEIFSSGTGLFDEEDVYVKIPSDLNIDADKAKGVVQDIAQHRLSNSLIQAVALLRQRKRDGVVASLNDMLACEAAVASEPLSWSSPEELADLYCVYLKSIPKRERLDRLQYLLGISDSTAAALRDTAERGALPMGNEEEEIVF